MSRELMGKLRDKLTCDLCYWDGCRERKATYVCCSPTADNSRFICERHLGFHFEVCGHKGDNMIIPISQTIHGGARVA